MKLLQSTILAICLSGMPAVAAFDIRLLDPVQDSLLSTYVSNRTSSIEDSDSGPFQGTVSSLGTDSLAIATGGSDRSNFQSPVSYSIQGSAYAGAGYGSSAHSISGGKWLVTANQQFTLDVQLFGNVSNPADTQLLFYVQDIDHSLLAYMDKMFIGVASGSDATSLSLNKSYTLLGGNYVVSAYTFARIATANEDPFQHNETSFSGDLIVTGVPEPSTAIFGWLVLVFALCQRRRFQHKAIVA